VSVTAVVVTYRTGPVLREALERLLGEPELARLVIVNNGNPPTVTRALADLAATDPRVRLVTGHGNIGFARASNLGASLAETNHLLFVNPDGLIDPGALARLVDAGAGLREPWIIGPRLANPDGTEQRGGRRDVLTPWRALVEWLHLYRLAPNHPYFRTFNRHDTPAPDTITPVQVVSGAAMFMPRRTFARLGGFDNAFFLHVEDIDLCVRLLNRGGTAWFCPDVTVYHHASSSDVSATFIEWHKARGFARYFAKHFDGAYPPGFLSVVISAVFARFIVQLPLLAVRDARRRLRRDGSTAAELEDVRN
jgi:GT2 family glycosyltransferase